MILYILLGVLALAGAFRADTRGWLASRPDRLTNVPASVRDNPGAYRSLYQASPRFIGGK